MDSVGVRGTNCGNKKWLPILDLFWCLHRSPGSKSRDGESGFATNALGDPVAAIPPLFSFSSSLSLACRPSGDLMDMAHTHTALQETLLVGFAGASPAMPAIGSSVGRCSLHL